MNERVRSTERRRDVEATREQAGSHEHVGGASGREFAAGDEPVFRVEQPAGRFTDGLDTGIRRPLPSALDALVSLLLNLIVTKSIAIFVFWLCERANRTTFHGRAELVRRVRRAQRAGEPVLFASNHLSMFDDPAVPMALFRTGPRAAVELSGLVAMVILCWVAPPTLVPPRVFVLLVISYLLGAALFGARKTWWSIGDLVNFSGASALRGKLEYARDGPLSPVARALLTVADPLIFFFMRTSSVKTILVDRRPGAAGRQSRVRGVARAIELAASGGQVWAFFEGGRTRKPDEIRPARSGIGQLVKGLHAQGVRPLIIAIHHRGLEHVIPMSSSRWFTSGHRIDIRWSEFALNQDGAPSGLARDAQKLADDIRTAVIHLQSAWRSEHSNDV